MNGGDERAALTLNSYHNTAQWPVESNILSNNTMPVFCSRIVHIGWRPDIWLRNLVKFAQFFQRNKKNQTSSFIVVA